jgi:hypothetical protein
VATFHLPLTLSISNSEFCSQRVFICFVWFSEKTAIICSNSVNQLIFVMVVGCTFFEVREAWLNVKKLFPVSWSLTCLQRKLLQIHPELLQALWNSAKLCSRKLACSEIYIFSFCWSVMTRNFRRDHSAVKSLCIYLLSKYITLRI